MGEHIREIVITAADRDGDRHIRYYALTYRAAEKVLPRLQKNSSWHDWKIERNPELEEMP